MRPRVFFLSARPPGFGRALRRVFPSFCLSISLVALTACAATRSAPSSPPTPADLERVEVDFDWGAENESEQAFVADFRTHLANLTREKPLSVDLIIAAFDDTLRAWLGTERFGALTHSGDVDWYEPGLDLGDGNLLHVEFDFDEDRGYVTETLLITGPEGKSVRAWAYEVGRAEPVFASSPLPVPDFGGVEVEVGGMFDHFENIETVRLALKGPRGERRAVYRCFPRDDPSYTVFSFQNPQDLDAQAKDFGAIAASIDVDDRWIFSDPDADLARLYQQISIVRAVQSPFERIERVVEVLGKAGEEELLTSLVSARFPGGVTLAVERETYRQPVIRVSIHGEREKLAYLKPVTLDEVYSSGAIGRRWVERAQTEEDFNFGSWLPDLWRGANEELFVSVYRMNRARTLEAGKTVAKRAVFDRTVRDLTAIGVYFDRMAVRIGGEPYEIEITDQAISRFLADLGSQAQAPPGGVRTPALPLAPPQAPAVGERLHWDLERYQEAGMTFLRDHQFVYYLVQEEDVRNGLGLDGILSKLRARVPGRYDYPIAFSGFRDEHLRPGMNLVIPEPPEARAIPAATLKSLIEKACREEGYDSPRLVYAIVWNESRAGKDNFFRFEPGRLDAVLRLRQNLGGEARKRFDDVYGRFGYLLAGSYGPGHILYENAWAMGFRGSPGEFALPEVNIPYIIRFLKSNGIDGRTSIEEVSRIYNGPWFRRNGYHLRLKQNLARAERVFRFAGG